MRGTTRDPARARTIEEAGLEAVVADPDRAASVLDHVGDVTVVCWLLGSAQGEPEVIAAIHGPRLERVLEKLVDTPVHGFLYEGAGKVQRKYLEGGAEIVRAAAERWRIPVEVTEHDPDDHEGWTAATLEAVRRLVS